MLALLDRNFATVAMLVGMIILASAALILLLSGKVTSSDPGFQAFATGASGLGMAIAGYSSHKQSDRQDPNTITVTAKGPQQPSEEIPK